MSGTRRRHAVPRAQGAGLITDALQEADATGKISGKQLRSCSGGLRDRFLGASVCVVNRGGGGWLLALEGGREGGSGCYELGVGPGARGRRVPGQCLMLAALPTRIASGWLCI